MPSIANPASLGKLMIVDKLLTTIARGYVNPQMIGTSIFPIVNVDTISGKYPKFGKERFIYWETNRALGGDSNQRDGLGVTEGTYSLQEKDLERPIDYLIEKIDNIGLIRQEIEANKDGIDLALEMQIANLVTDSTNYDSDNAATWTDEFLNDPLVDPLEKIDNLCDDLQDIIGTRANAIWMGNKVWRKLKYNPKLKDVIKVTSDRVITPQLIAAWLEVDKVLIGQKQYIPDAQTGTASESIWGNYLGVFYDTTPSGVSASMHKPSFGYTFRMKGYPYSDKYIENGGKITNYRTTDMFDPQIVGSDAGILITNPIDPTEY